MSKDALILLLFGIVALRTIAKGHQLVAEGNKLIGEGWAIFDDVVGQAGMGELPQLLRSVRRRVTPVTPVKEEVKMEEEKGHDKGDEGEASESGSGRGMTITPVREGGPESPITIQVKMAGGKVVYKYKCPQCEVVKVSKRGLDSHIRQVHTLKAFMCCFCEFTTYNLDSLHRHEKVHK